MSKLIKELSADVLGTNLFIVQSKVQQWSLINDNKLQSN